MKSLTAPSVKLASFCTCGESCEFCASCRAAADPGRCPDCGAELLTCEGLDGQTESVCPNCTRWEPTYAA
jgi:predicted RNA-binding Zn-ribbon protein involved in translation (DUF1610 family)